MNYRGLKSTNKLILMICILINRCNNKHIYNSELPYKIQDNSIEYDGGLLRVIDSNEEVVHIGAKLTIFQVPFNLSLKLQPFLHWKGNASYCNGGTSTYIQFMSEIDEKKPIFEVCGSDSCQLECRTYDKYKKDFNNRHSGYKLIPTDVGLSSKHIHIGENLIVAVPTEHNRALIALYSNRSFHQYFENPMITPRFSFPDGQVKFLQISNYRDKIYFTFTETESEMINYHNTFYNVKKPKNKFTRLGRICKSDQGIQLSEYFFTSFIKTTLTCQLPIPKPTSTKQFIDYTQALAASQPHGKSGTFLILFRSTQPTTSDFMHSSVFCQYNFHDIEKQLENSKLAILKEIDSTKYWSLDMTKHNFSTCYNSFQYLSPNTEWMVANHLQPSAPPITIETNRTIGNPSSFEVVRSMPITLIMPNNDTYFMDIDLIYIGTDKGFISKSIFLNRDFVHQFRSNRKLRLLYNKPILKFTHSIKVFNDNLSIDDIKINLLTRSIIVISKSMVKRIPLEFCSTDCWTCNSNIDPMCQWNPKTKICERKLFSERRHLVQIYNCQTDPAIRSKNVLKEKTIDLFWLIFSLVTFFSVVAVVLTVSIAYRYSPISLPRSAQTTSSTIYQMINDKDSTNPKKKLRNMHNSITSSLTDSSSSKRHRMKMSMPNKNSNSFNSTKQSLVFKNKFYLNTNKPRHHNDATKLITHKGTKRLKTHFYAITKETSHLSGCKSCDAIFQLSTRS